jgi:nucleotide-binding universal stress UspA family protein
MKVLVTYDGSLHAKDALKYGINKVRENGGELIALNVFNNRLFIDYDALPGAEERARRESMQYLNEAGNIIKNEGNGIKASLVLGEGNPEEEILSLATDERVDLLLCPAKYKSVMKKFASAFDMKTAETITEGGKMIALTIPSKAA